MFFWERRSRGFRSPGQGSPCNPQNCIHTYNFWQKGDWNCEFMVPLDTHSVMKRREPPCDHRKSHISVISEKMPWNLAYLARKIPNFLRQGGAVLLQPLPGGQPLDPRECLAQALGLLASFAVAWAPLPQVENLPKPVFNALIVFNSHRRRRSARRS